MHSKDVPQPMTGFQEFRNIRDEGIDNLGKPASGSTLGEEETA